MSEIIEYGDEAREFLGDDVGNNDLQRGQIQRNFQIMRSSLQEYDLLGEGKSYQFQVNPSQHSAVGFSNKPLIPMMIALVPPDIYPSGNFKKREVPAPADINIRPVEVKSHNGSNLISSEVDGTRVAASGGEEGTNTVETSISEAEESSSSYLDDFQDRYESFRKSSRDADVRLADHNDPIHKGRDEIEDTLVKENKNVKEARSEHINEMELRQQVLAMRELPPLILYVNPSEFSVSYQHVIADGDKGRKGHIIQHWGLEMPTVNASGNIGATYIDSTDGVGRKAGGLTRMLRRGSAAYQHFMNLFRIYKNNSYIYNVDNKISIMGSVQIFYDDVIYTGSFDSFSISESEDSPFSLEYDFEFTVRFEDRVDRLSRESGV